MDTHIWLPIAVGLLLFVLIGLGVILTPAKPEPKVEPTIYTVYVTFKEDPHDPIEHGGVIECRCYDGFVFIQHEDHKEGGAGDLVIYPESRIYDVLVSEGRV